MSSDLVWSSFISWEDKQVDINTIIHSGTHVRANALIEVEIQWVELILVKGCILNKQQHQLPESRIIICQVTIMLVPLS